MVTQHLLITQILTEDRMVHKRDKPPTCEVHAPFCKKSLHTFQTQQTISEGTRLCVCVHACVCFLVLKHFPSFFQEVVKHYDFKNRASGIRHSYLNLECVPA